MLVGNLYRPLDSSHFLPEDFNDKFESMLPKVCCEDKEALLLGDFNCDYGSQNNNRPLKQIISSYCFCQQVDSPTRLSQGSESMIDLVLSNMPQNICKTSVLQTFLSDHEMIGTIRKVNSLKLKSRTITCRNYKNYNKEKLQQDLLN